MEKLEIKDINSSFAKQIQIIYENSFPRDERLPFAHLFQPKFDESTLTAYIENEKVVGFTFVLHYKDCEYLYFFAVDETLRGKGYGSKIIKNFANQYDGKNIYFCVEEPKEEIQKRRIEFYKRNGFLWTEMFYVDCPCNIKYFIMGKGSLSVEMFEEIIFYFWKEKVKVETKRD